MASLRWLTGGSGIICRIRNDGDSRSTHVGLVELLIVVHADVQTVLTRLLGRHEGAETHRHFAAGDVDRDMRTANGIQPFDGLSNRKAGLAGIVRRVDRDYESVRDTRRARLQLVGHTARLCAGHKHHTPGFDLTQYPRGRFCLLTVNTRPS